MIKKILVLLMMLILLLTCNAEMYFGNYWQSYEIDGVKTPIKWIILDETNDAYLLISKYSLDASIFGSNKQFTTWENSIVRSFLNTYFYNNAFSAAEKEKIILTTVKPDKNNEYKIVKQGKITKDYVFILSAKEATEYFNTNKSRIAYATDFARIGHARILGKYWAGAYTSPITGATCWRLRTMGADNYHACVVCQNGSIFFQGDILYAPHYAIRPCIWIKKF